jgi:hypothetical protein
MLHERTDSGCSVATASHLRSVPNGRIAPLNLAGFVAARESVCVAKADTPAGCIPGSFRGGKAAALLVRSRGSY